jgi:PAS domain S-box-containing protein
MGFDENAYKMQLAEKKISDVSLEREELRILYEDEKLKRDFYELVTEFTFGWELWIDPEGSIKYCSPSCFDLTGYTSNQIINAKKYYDLVVYESDKVDFKRFIKKSLNQLVINQSHEFRILTRHKELRWCSMNVRGVYDRQGRYLGVRASIHNITHLKQALGKIHSLTTGKEIENRAKLRFKSELDLKERELVSFLLQLSQKNELIAYAAKSLKKMQIAPENSVQAKISALLSVLENIPEAPVDWKMIVVQLENLHPGFLGRLDGRHPNLTPKEKKLCAFLRLDLSSKDISGLQNVQPKSIEIARVRLRKKLKLVKGLRLATYIHTI